MSMMSSNVLFLFSRNKHSGPQNYIISWITNKFILSDAGFLVLTSADLLQHWETFKALKYSTWKKSWLCPSENSSVLLGILSLKMSVFFNWKHRQFIKQCFGVWEKKLISHRESHLVQEWIQHIGFLKEMLGCIHLGIFLSNKFDDLGMYLPVCLLCWIMLSYLWLRGTCFVMLSCFHHYSFFSCFHVFSWYSHINNKSQLGFCQTFLEGS